MRVSAMIGVVCRALLALVFVSCEKNHSPDWDLAGTGKSPVAVEMTESPQAEEPLVPQISPAEVVTQPAKIGRISSIEKTISDKDGLRFIAYNVQNWLTMDRLIEKSSVKGAPKPESEKNAVVKILVSNTPDVVGLCEIGEASDLAEIQAALKAQGLDLPHSHFTGGVDPVRHVGLLSRYPILATAKPKELEYRMQGKTFGFNRGILDATISVSGESYRFLGVHLKSKREVEEGDQEQMRINEAHLLRRHVDSILQSDPQARLIVYGDFNDTYPSKAVRVVTGSTDESRRLMPIYFKDKDGGAWTHHWSHQDIYSRIDFVTVSAALRNEVKFWNCRIIDDAGWDNASDHRALLAVFK